MSVSATAFVALSQAAKRVDQAAEGIARATRPAGALEDHVELSAEAVSMLVAKNEYAAAMELAKTADEISRRAIGLLAGQPNSEGRPPSLLKGPKHIAG